MYRVTNTWADKTDKNSGINITGLQCKKVLHMLRSIIVCSLKKLLAKLDFDSE